MKNKNQNEGITLIALVITIIVLLILAGVTISTLTGDNGLLQKAGQAKNASEMSNLQDEVQLALIEDETEKHINSNSSIIEKLKAIFEKVHGTGNIDVAKSGKNYKVKVKNTKTAYRVRYDGTIRKYEEMDQTNVYGKLDDNNDKILHLSGVKLKGFEEIQKAYYGNYSIGGSYSGIEKVIIDEPIAPTYIVFRDCAELVEIENIEKLHTENMTNMNSMFYGCRKLNKLDVSNFDTSNVTNMGSIFRYCENLKSIDLSNFDTSKLVTMQYMFISTYFEELDLSGFNTENVTTFDSMFYSSGSLKSINLSSFDTGKSENMSSMFRECSSLTKLDVSKFNTGNVKTMENMFNGCSSLTQLDLGNFNTSNVTSLRTIFMQCNNLISLDLSNWDTNKVTDFYCMFYGCTGLKNVNLSGKFKINDGTTYNGIFSYVKYTQGIKIKSTQDTANKIISTGNETYYLTIDNFEIV